MLTSNPYPIVRIRAIRELDRPAVQRLLLRFWGGPGIVTRGRMHFAHTYPGFLARTGERITGLLTYQIRGERCEIISLNSLRRRRGIGTRLVLACQRRARTAGCREVWLITTNDNLRAIGFYQQRGFRIRRVHAGAIERSRRLKPSIPRIGMSGIPIRDEIEMYKPLSRRAARP